VEFMVTVARDNHLCGNLFSENPKKFLEVFTRTENYPGRLKVFVPGAVVPKRQGHVDIVSIIGEEITSDKWF